MTNARTLRNRMIEGDVKEFNEIRENVRRRCPSYDDVQSARLNVALCLKASIKDESDQVAVMDAVKAYLEAVQNNEYETVCDLFSLIAKGKESAYIR